MIDFGIKISRPGQDVKTAGLTNLYFHSGYPIMKTYLVGSSEYYFSSDTSDVDILINHNLGYLPIVWLSISGPIAQSDTCGWWAYYYNSGDNRALRTWSCHVTTTQLKIQYKEYSLYGTGYNPTGETWDFKYYIFIEKIN